MPEFVLYMDLILYDTAKDKIFEGRFYMNEINISFHKNGIGFKKFKYRGELNNSYENTIILGSL